MNVNASEAPDEIDEDLRVVVYPAKQNGLIPDNDTGRCKRRMARSTIEVTSRGWLKCVCKQTCLKRSRPREKTSRKAPTHSSSLKNFMGCTARDFVANLMRLICRMSKRALPMLRR